MLLPRQGGGGRSRGKAICRVTQTRSQCHHWCFSRASTVWFKCEPCPYARFVIAQYAHCPRNGVIKRGESGEGAMAGGESSYLGSRQRTGLLLLVRQPDNPTPRGSPSRQAETCSALGSSCIHFTVTEVMNTHTHTPQCHALSLPRDGHGQSQLAAACAMTCFTPKHLLLTPMLAPCFLPAPPAQLPEHPG